VLDRVFTHNCISELGCVHIKTLSCQNVCRMESTEDQYARIKDSLPVQREAPSMKIDQGGHVPGS
jgi:hypothetical protein